MRNNRRIFSLTLALVLTFVLAAHAGWEEGVSAFQSGNYAQAAEEFRTVVEDQPEWAGGHRMLGQSLLKLGRSQEALTHLRRAYDLQPDDVAIQMILGQAYVQSRRYRDAGELLGKVNVASLPKAQQGPLHQMRAVAYDKTGQTDRAIQELSRAVKLTPNNANLQFQYGTLMFNNGDTAASVLSLEKALSLDSGDATKQKAYADALLRYAREQRGAAKVTTYRKAVSAASRLVSSSAAFENLMLLGGAQLGAQAYADAAATFQRATAKNNRDWLPHYYIGQALTNTGKFSQAESALHEALAQTDVPAETRRIWGQLGFVYEKRKSYRQAKTAYEKAGDPAAVKRVNENQEIDAFNIAVEEEKAEIHRLKAEEAELEKQLRDLEKGEVPPSP